MANLLMSDAFGLDPQDPAVQREANDGYNASVEKRETGFRPRRAGNRFLDTYLRVNARSLPKGNGVNSIRCIKRAENRCRDQARLQLQRRVLSRSFKVDLP